MIDNNLKFILPQNERPIKIVVENSGLIFDIKEDGTIQAQIPLSYLNLKDIIIFEKN